MEKLDSQSWIDKFTQENQTTNWQYGAFQHLIETHCDFQDKLTLVEIGVARGGHSRHLLDNFVASIDKLIGVDPYMAMYDKHDAFAKKQQVEFDHLYHWVNHYCQHPKFQLYRSTSEVVTKWIENDSIDAVYIDGDHTYEGVKTDILSWLPKLKKGGMMVGDDFLDMFPGTKQAVKELVPQYQLHDGVTWYWKKT